MGLLEELLAIQPEEVATWPEKEQNWYAGMLEREMALSSPAAFATRHSIGDWQPYRHITYTSDAIVGMVEHDDCDLLLVDQPVRHGKSVLCSKWAPAWFLAKHPAWPVLLSSYEASFAELWGGRVREIIREHGHHYGLELKRDSRAKAAWELVSGGGMNTAGANGSITGRGGLLLICDDPIKGREEAMSAVERRKMKEWWDTVWITRREAGHHWPDGRPVKTKYLLIMSRWHVDDVMGWLISRADEMGMRVKRLRMPAIAEDDDLLGRRPGEALCPELFDEATLASIRKDSPIAWPALYQQRPVAIGGGMFQRAWFKEYSRTTIDGDEYFQLGERLIRRDDCLIFGTMDTAYTNSKRSDYTALAIWAVTPNDPTDLILLQMYRKRVEHAEHAPLITEAWRDYKPRWVGLEKISATLALFAQAQREGVVMRWLDPDRNKVARAETAVALAEQGRVYLPADADTADFIEECVTFPQGEHDDMVDVFAYAAGEVYKRAVRGRRHQRGAETYEERVWDKVRKMHTPDRSHPVLGRW